MSQVYISIGSNLGNRFENINKAIKNIRKHLGTVTGVSDIYETESWSYKDMDYLNCVIEIDTSLSAQNLLKESQNIEIILGRTSKTIIIDEKAKYQARIIDIDILFYNQEIIKSENLIIPHPHLHLRNFVLKPMLQIAKDFIHPVFHEKIESLYIKCQDNSFVKLFKSA